jgi:hypothetical protein
MQYIVVKKSKYFDFSYFRAMEMLGNLRKMEALHEAPVQYFLTLGEDRVRVNELLGKKIHMEYQGHIHCIRCGRETKKSFAQGYCYPCFTTAPETEECVLRPELCRAHEGVARDMAYAQDHCLIDQVVYLSLTSTLKVGVTRTTQVPTRWIDQGAVAAIELARTPNRHTAGLMEVALKQHMADKTNWRRMLTGAVDEGIRLEQEKARMAAMLPSELSGYVSREDRIWEFSYPVLQSPGKVGSLNFDKTPRVEGVLEGIKGQYLIFRGNRVINIRKFGGYQVRFLA